MFDAQSASSLVDLVDEVDNSYEQIKIPYGKGIAGYVALTGHSLNITDAYLDERFNAQIDKITGYKTKSILCLPILNELGECIAVAEAINKLNDEASSEDACVYFSQEDEEVCFFLLNYILNSNINNSNFDFISNRHFLNSCLS